MFAVGEYVACGSRGVCVVNEITTLNLPGVDKNRKYYILKPVYQPQSTVYVPLDGTNENMRPVLGEKEAKALVDAIPQIPTLTTDSEKLWEQTYRECMRSGDCVEWVKVLKTIYYRREQRQRAGRKPTAVDTKYSHLVQDSLYGELAVALSVTREEVEEYIKNRSLLSC